VTYTLPDVLDEQARARAAEARERVAAGDARLLAALDTLTDRCGAVKATPGLPAPVVELADVVTDTLALLRSEVTRDQAGAR
jgi:hypothetical protein